MGHTKIGGDISLGFGGVRCRCRGSRRTKIDAREACGGLDDLVSYGLCTRGRGLAVRMGADVVFVVRCGALQFFVLLSATLAYILCIILVRVICRVGVLIALSFALVVELFACRADAVIFWV